MKAFGLELNRDSLKRYLIPALCVVLSLVFLVAIILPRLPKFTDLRSEKEQAETSLEKLQSKTQVLQKLASRRQELETDYSLMKEVVTLEPEVPTLVDEVQRVATDSALTTKNLVFAGEAGKAGKKAATEFTTLGVRLAVEGSYQNLLSFLKAAEKAARVLRITGLKFTSAAGEAGKAGLVEANIGLDSYYLPEGGQALLEVPINFSLDNQKYQDLMSTLKGLRIYRAIIDSSGVGKRDPFSR